ncbi:MAG: HAD family phosphatase [Chloroflexi bacterium]|nr:HAD family phosphatase [Chloroflexota bacterium]
MNSLNFCPQAIIFDMDGLLVDSEPVWAMAEGALLQERGKQWDIEIQRPLIGMRMRDFLVGIRSGYGLSDTVDELVAELIGRMTKLVPTQVVPRPGAPELLEYLLARGIPCAIASSSPMPIIDAVVTSQGWDRYFQTHVCGDDVTHGKPAPDIYLEAARRIGIAPEACLALEDSPNGSRAAVAAGMVTIAVPDLSHTSHSAFEVITPHVFDNLHEVQTALELCLG